jgi:hypothetical protein
MWKIDNLERKEYLVYNIICYYIQYRKPCSYGMLDFTIRCLGIYVLCYYYKLEIDNWSYYAWHQTVISGWPNFAMTWMESTPNHVENIIVDVSKQWEETMVKCQKLIELTDLGAKMMAVL